MDTIPSFLQCHRDKRRAKREEGERQRGKAEGRDRGRQKGETDRGETDRGETKGMVGENAKEGILLTVKYTAYAREQNLFYDAQGAVFGADQLR